MITVAVAGGTSAGLGRSILTAIARYPNQLKGIVLSRATSKTPQCLEEMGVEVRKVDYASEDSLYEALRGVHTVICILLATDGTWASSQISLLNASLRADVTRFAPAEFGVGPLAAQNVDILRPQIAVMDACREAKQSKPSFRYTGFHVGLFMNYLSYGSKNKEAATNGLNDDWIGDVGKSVAAACTLPPGSWREDLSMVGETIALDEVVNIIEKIKGGEMEVTFRRYEQVVDEMDKEEVVYPNRMWAQLEVMQAKNRIGEGIMEPVLNGLCPDVKPMGVEQYVRAFWSP